MRCVIKSVFSTVKLQSSFFFPFPQKSEGGGGGGTGLLAPPNTNGPAIHDEGNFYLTREVTGDKNIRKIRHSVKAKYN